MFGFYGSLILIKMKKKKDKTNSFAKSKKSAKSHRNSVCELAITPGDVRRTKSTNVSLIEVTGAVPTTHILFYHYNA